MTARTRKGPMQFVQKFFGGREPADFTFDFHLQEAIGLPPNAARARVRVLPGKGSAAIEGPEAPCATDKNGEWRVRRGPGGLLCGVGADRGL